MIPDIRFEGLWDCTVKTSFESTLREYIGDAPENERCNIVVTSYGTYCILLAKTSEHSFRKVFTLRGREFVDALSAWLKQFPLQDRSNTPDSPVDQRKSMCPLDTGMDPEQPNARATCESAAGCEQGSRHSAT
jgi:hypothetical protein